MGFLPRGSLMVWADDVLFLPAPPDQTVSREATVPRKQGDVTSPLEFWKPECL
jgi:hypothetical protein